MGVQIPGRVGIQFAEQPGDSATPISIAFGADGGMISVAKGGLSKLEHVAGLVAANLAPYALSQIKEQAEVHGTSPEEIYQQIAQQSVTVAAMVLDICAAALADKQRRAEGAAHQQIVS